MTAPLYTIDILRLAASTAAWPRLADPQATSEKRSPVCGSRITVDVVMNAAGRVELMGQEVRACALGQAAATLMGKGAIGKSLQDLIGARDALKSWLAGEQATPGAWPGLAIFEPALPHSARHAAILLAFEAVAEAAEMAVARC